MSARRRPVRRFGAALALFALWLQLVLSFAHVHPEDFFPPDATTPTAALRAAVDYPVPAAPTKPTAPGHDDCAICISMAMVGASALPAPIVLPPPPVFGRPSFPPPLATVSLAAPRHHFRSRAPPFA